MKQENITEKFLEELSLKLYEKPIEKYSIMEEEKIHIKEKFFNKIEDSYFNELEYFTYGLPGLVLIKDPKKYWIALMGRSWIYDKNDDTILPWTLN